METSWPRRPVIYEINTWVWLNSLSRHYQRAITLGNVPTEQWDAIAALGVDAVWLMGVWERSPEGIRIANRNAGLQADFRRALPDYTPADNVGSAYCVRRYVVDEHLGGPAGLAMARQMLGLDETSAPRGQSAGAGGPPPAGVQIGAPPEQSGNIVPVPDSGRMRGPMRLRELHSHFADRQSAHRFGAYLSIRRSPTFCQHRSI